MGDRVAVLRKGELQQVDKPQALYEHPVNLFVAGFIGSPAMNLVRRERSRARRRCARGRVRWLPAADPGEVARSATRLCAAYAGRTIVLGIRPEDMEDASLVADAPADRRITSTVELREALGSDVVVHFTIARARRR